jgi:hypothetical protein
VLQRQAGGALVGTGGDQTGDLVQLAVAAGVAAVGGHVRIVRDGADLRLIST